MKNIIIAGYGNIGKHIEKEFQSKDITIFKYDKIFEEELNRPIATVEQIEEMKFHVYKNNITNIQNVLFDVIFLCLPTELNVYNDLDISPIMDTLDTLRDNGISTGVIVVKSTVPIGTMDILKKEYKNFNLVFSPEHYGTTIHAPESPNFLILAGDDKDTKKVADLYHMVKTKDFRITFTEYKIAEVAKFMENVFLATKVKFCAEFESVARKLNFDYNKLRELFVLDERMGDSHTYINPAKPYWDSHCLNKDVPAFITEAHKLRVPIPMITEMYLSNKHIKEYTENKMKKAYDKCKSNEKLNMLDAMFCASYEKHMNEPSITPEELEAGKYKFEKDNNDLANTIQIMLQDYKIDIKISKREDKE